MFGVKQNENKIELNNLKIESYGSNSFYRSNRIGPL